MAKLTKTMFNYNVLYNDDLGNNGQPVRTLWPENEDVFPNWFLDKITERGWDYQVMLKSPEGIQCIDLV